MNNDPISLIFLAYNEAATIRSEICQFYQEIIKKIPGSEFIIAEEGSYDGTDKIIKEYSQKWGVIHLSGKERKGFTRAMMNAISVAKNPYILFCDTGERYNPEDFWSLYEKRHHYDLIIGRRSNRKDQRIRRLLTWGYNFFIRKYFSIPFIYDCDSGLRLFNRQVVSEIINSPDLFFKILPNSEIAIRTCWQGLQYVEIPVSYRQRKGESKWLRPLGLPSTVYRAIKNIINLKKKLQIMSPKGHSYEHKKRRAS